MINLPFIYIYISKGQMSLLELLFQTDNFTLDFTLDVGHIIYEQV